MKEKTWIGEKSGYFDVSSPTNYLQCLEGIRRWTNSSSWPEVKRAGSSPPPKVTTDLMLLLRLLGAIGCAATLALARVLAFTSVLFFGLLVVLLVFPLVLALLLGA